MDTTGNGSRRKVWIGVAVAVALVAVVAYFLIYGGSGGSGGSGGGVGGYFVFALPLTRSRRWRPSSSRGLSRRPRGARDRVSAP
jgi:hypothetical protein